MCQLAVIVYRKSIRAGVVEHVLAQLGPLYKAHIAHLAFEVLLARMDAKVSVEGLLCTESGFTLNKMGQTPIRFDPHLG